MAMMLPKELNILAHASAQQQSLGLQVELVIETYGASHDHPA